MYAASQLPIDAQAPLLEQVKERGLTAQETERLVTRAKPTRGKPAKPGAPVHQVRLKTTHATVLVAFRLSAART